MAQLDQTNLLERARHIQLLICDVDGVMTNGQLHYQSNGLTQKIFHVQDGLGLLLLGHAGITTGVISACTSPLTKQRLSDLNIPHVYLGQKNKITAYNDLKNNLSLADESIAYMGDDLPDIPLLKQVGLAITVKDANPALLDYIHWQTAANGGQGAVREVCDLLLRAHDKHTLAINRYVES